MVQLVIETMQGSPVGDPGTAPAVLAGPGGLVGTGSGFGSTTALLVLLLVMVLLVLAARLTARRGRGRGVGPAVTGDQERDRRDGDESS